MNSILMLSRHIKHSNFVGTRVLCMQWGQNMNAIVVLVVVVVVSNLNLLPLRVQLTTYSSTASMCWLAFKLDRKIWKLKSFLTICLNPRFIFTSRFNHYVPFSIFHLCPLNQGCRWRPIPARPWCAGWHKDEIVNFASSGASKWYAELLMMSFDQNCVTHFKLICGFIVSLNATASCSPHQVCLCSAFLTSRSLWNPSKIVFLMIFYVSQMKKTFDDDNFDFNLVF